MERQDPDMGFVTFTGVSVTEDLASARIFYSVLGTEEEKLSTAECLDRMKWGLRRGMRRLESLKRAPDLLFVYDETPGKAARISEILETLNNEDKKESEPGGSAET